jgi:hypothetical protein
MIINLLTFIKKLCGRKPSDEIFGIYPHLYAIDVSTYSSYYTSYSGILNCLSCLKKHRLVDNLKQGTVGYIIQTKSWGYRDYCLFESLDGRQVVIKDLGLKKVTDKSILTIHKNRNEHLELSYEQIGDIFIDFEDDNYKVNINKIENGWDIVIQFERYHTCTSLQDLESNISKLNQSLKRLVNIYGYVPTVIISFPRIVIKIDKI